MSVVNKMLKDLESRKAETDAPNNYRPLLHKPPRLSRRWVYSLVTMAVLVVAVALLTMSERVAATLVQQVAKAPKVEAVPPKLSAAPEPAPAATEKQPLIIRPINELLASPAGKKEDLVTSNLPENAAKDTVSEAAPENQTADSDSGMKNGELTVTASTGKQELHNLRERIRLALARPDKREAITLMYELADVQPENIAVRKKLAAVMFADGKVAQAREQLTLALSLFPADHSLRLMLARLYQQQGQAEQALQVLATADDYQPVSTDLIAFRASLARTEQRFADALTNYHLLVARAPDDARWWLGVATSADHLGQARVALNAYRRAMTRGELNTEVQQFMRQRTTVLAGERDE